MADTALYIHPLELQRVQAGVQVDSPSPADEISDGGTSAANAQANNPEGAHWEGGPREQPDTTRPEAETQADPLPAKVTQGRLEEIAYRIELDKILDHRKTIYTEEEKAKAWRDAADMVKIHSDEMVARWNAQIDTYLVFAGLFSAILTAFNVQSYPLLQPTPPDVTALAFQQLSLQLQSFRISLSYINSTHPAASTVPTGISAPSSVPRSAVWLNVLWFSGLILSLTSTVVGILVKQWLSEYSSGVGGNSREAARLRQYRLNNLVKWHVGDFIVLIPVLLLTSLCLFFAGILILLWTLHPTVAIVASALVGVVAAMTACVTFLPLLKVGCSYVTPQTFALLPLWQYVIYPAIAFLRFVVKCLICYTPLCLFSTCCSRTTTRMANDSISTVGLLAVLDRAPTPSSKSTLSKSTRRGHERSIVLHLGDSLDTDILLKAYESSLDAKAVSSAAICLLDQRPECVVDYFLRFDNAVKAHFGDGSDAYHYGPRSNLVVVQAVLCASYLDSMQLIPSHARRSLDAFLSINRYLTHSESDRRFKFVESRDPRHSAQMGLLVPWIASAFPTYSGLAYQESPLSVARAKVAMLCRGLLRASPKLSDHESAALEEFRKGITTSPELPLTIHRTYQAILQCIYFAENPCNIRTLDTGPAKVHLNVLRAVDEFLWCAARILESDTRCQIRANDGIRQMVSTTLQSLPRLLQNLRRVSDDGKWNNRRIDCAEYVYRLSSLSETLDSHKSVFLSAVVWRYGAGSCQWWSIVRRICLEVNDSRRSFKGSLWEWQIPANYGTLKNATDKLTEEAWGDHYWVYISGLPHSPRA